MLSFIIEVDIMVFAFRIVKAIEVLLVEVRQCSSCKECVINDGGDDDARRTSKRRICIICIGLSPESHISVKYEILNLNQVIIHNLIGCTHTQK